MLPAESPRAVTAMVKGAADRIQKTASRRNTNGCFQVA